MAEGPLLGPVSLIASPGSIDGVAGLQVLR